MDFARNLDTFMDGYEGEEDEEQEDERLPLFDEYQEPNDLCFLCGYRVDECICREADPFNDENSNL